MSHFVRFLGRHQIYPPRTPHEVERIWTSRGWDASHEANQGLNQILGPHDRRGDWGEVGALDFESK